MIANGYLFGFGFWFSLASVVTLVLFAIFLAARIMFALMDARLRRENEEEQERLREMSEEQRELHKAQDRRGKTF